MQAPDGTIYRTNHLRKFMFAHPEWFTKPATQYVTAYNFLQKKEPGKRLCTFAGGWVVLSNTSRHDDMAQSIHWWRIKSPDGKEHLVIGERYRHFLQTCGYFEVGSEPYYCFKCGLKKAIEEGTPVTLKNGWIIARPVPLDEFRLVDIVGPEMEQEYIYDANGNSHPKRLSDVRNYKRGQIEWTIADPDGRIYHTKSLFNFLRERKDFSENPRSAVAMFSQIIAIRCGLRNGKKLTLKNGWTALDRSDVHDLIEQRKQSCQESATNKPIERKHRDLTGQRFGMLTALYRLDGKGKAKWLCRCDCGGECYLNCAELKARRDCGCSAAQAAAERIKAGANGNRLGTNINTITNIMSGKLRKTNTSGITGVSIKGNCYRARIVVRGREINLGKFTTLEAAVRARKEAEKKYFAPLIEQDKENQKE